MNKLAGHLFYLAGPIDDCKEEKDFIEWRLDISKFLWSIGAGVVDPCSKPVVGYNEDENLRVLKRQLKKEKKYDEISKVMEDIVSVDLHLLDISSAVILYVDNDVHMCGSYSEITYSALEKKPAIVFSKNGKENVPDWLFGLLKHDLFFNNIEEVKEYLHKVNNGKSTPCEDRWRFLDMNKIFGLDEDQNV